ncbi:hypothetical protein DTL21_01940 [Bremerella cremea]|uniref:Uncharacterized protein n=2 Tax=Pirellulales TaxID=2691354 RepID=A0A2S8G4Z9_9BACT|nr:hypothetical protein C5Y83_01940 [Blastopirellula marina]RCS50996.1 hypothetical protein DTL21_01940 [Bremerella cremea]
MGGLTQTHHLPTGKPSHPHSDDSLCAETSEFENDEVEAEIVYLATLPDLVTPVMQVVSERVYCQPVADSVFQTQKSLLLRGPPVA